MITLNPDTTDRPMLLAWLQAALTAQHDNLRILGSTGVRHITNYSIRGSDQKTTYHVNIDLSNGKPRIHCTCIAGSFERPCKHAALAADHLFAHTLMPRLYTNLMGAHLVTHEEEAA